MTRKLFSTALMGFALLLLMGAGADGSAAGNPVNQTDVDQIYCLVESDSQDELTARGTVVSAVTGTNALALAEDVDRQLTVNGEPVPSEVNRIQRNGTTYVALVPMAQCLDTQAKASWNASTQTVTITTSGLNLTATVGQKYLVANGRYLYLPEGVEVVDDRVTVPLSTLVEAFDAKLTWNAATGTAAVTRGSGAILSGNQYYNSNDLYWLSRVIYAESGNQSLEGKMAVGNVILNRVKSPIFPNTVEGVLSQKNQFTTYASGALSRCTPTESCIIAAKLVMDGGVVDEVKNALYFDSAASSWASRNRVYVATIGNHRFFA